uniref:Uncharacterized protein n=1 Tax=Alexandrium catenella TaxID=2925 RepID=A0A7S1S260_ALECA
MAQSGSLRTARLLFGALAVASAHDGTGLVQVGVSVVSPWQSRDACTCLGWKAVYVTGTAKPGDAKEWLPHGDYHPYRDIEENYCLKFDYSSHTVEKFTWCYVPASCGNLQGGRAVNARVSWKVCNAEQDTLMAELPPREMIKLITESGWLKDPTLLPVLSYPYHTEKWDDVSAFYGQPGNPIEPQMKEKMQRLRDSKTPTVICDSLDAWGNGNPDACGPPNSLKLVYGEEVWEFPHFGVPVCKQGCKA